VIVLVHRSDLFGDRTLVLVPLVVLSFKSEHEPRQNRGILALTVEHQPGDGLIELDHQMRSRLNAQVVNRAWTLIGPPNGA
jgi:hypothetical protein